MASLDHIRSKVAGIITDKGKTVTYVSAVAVYSAATGATVETVTSYSVKVTPPKRFENSVVDGELIQLGDAQVTLADYAKVVTPKSGDKITIDSEVWTVVAVGKVFSGELVATWKLQLRR